MQRTTPNFKIPYFVNPVDVEDYKTSQLKSLDKQAENDYVNDLKYRCQNEQVTKERLLQEASGLFFQDSAKIQRAHKMEMKACNRLEELSRIARGKK
jgi:DnaJ family protein B protein 12